MSPQEEANMDSKADVEAQKSPDIVEIPLDQPNSNHLIHPPDLQPATQDHAALQSSTPPNHTTSDLPPPDTRPAYSSFTRTQKRLIIASGSFAAFFSPMTGSIYFPALTTISQSLHVSSSAINLTVTTYLIWQGIAPMLIAGFSDTAGRRPAYILCFTIYIIANLCLSFTDSYTALLLLRMLQSAGSSGTVALANGMVADLVTSAERGEYIAYASMGTMLGPSLSPVIGGLIAENLDYHWIFRFLLILSVSFGVPFLAFLPETGRNIVGSGGNSVRVEDVPWMNRNVLDWWRIRQRRRRGGKGEEKEEGERERERVDEERLKEVRKDYKIRLPNPTPTFLILLDGESVVVLLVTGLALSCFYALSTGASASFKESYGFNDIQVALMFIPIGVGGIVSALTTGKIVDWNFRRWCKKVGVKADKRVRQDLSNFPIERARMEVALPLFWIGLAACIGYGWMMGHNVNLAGPVIMLMLFGWALIASNQALNALMVDIWPGKAAAATAANNFVRCELGAAASAAIEPMSKAMGRGWAYTLLALLGVAATPAVMVMMRYGIQWRKKRAEREERKSEKKMEKKRRKMEMEKERQITGNA